MEKIADRIGEVELELEKLLGFKRVAAFGDDQAELARTLNATYNKVGGEGPLPP
jgi:hypothetical protein